MVACKRGLGSGPLSFSPVGLKTEDLIKITNVPFNQDATPKTISPFSLYLHIKLPET
jgi:hypothetical protein